MNLRILICGDRRWTDRKAIEDFIKTLPKDTVIIEGECKGADMMARDLAYSYQLEVYQFPAQWERYGKAAGPIRNEAMIRYGRPDLVVAFHNNLSKSKGTWNMITRARKHGIPYQVIKSEQEEHQETK